MAVCQFFLQGHCRFGERCWNEHPRGGGGGRQGPPAPYGPGPGKGGGGPSSSSQRLTNVMQPSAAGYKDEEERLLQSVGRDMEVWDSSGQWIFSSYSPMKEKPNISGFADLSPEELRLEYYTCRANNDIQNFINSVQELAKRWKMRLLELKALNASTKAALLSELKNTVSQPLRAFGFKGQQTSSFGSSGFPVNSSSSASGFSFKISSSLVGASSGNTAAFGSSSAGFNAPAFGATNSPSVSRSVGFGSSAAPSAASFSFKLSETTSGFGSAGSSGFDHSAAAKSSSTAPLTGSGALNAAGAASPSPQASTGFGQTAGAAGHNVTSASSAGTIYTRSSSSYTPLNELTPGELKQFTRKTFEIGKIPLRPPPIELI